MRRDSTRRGLLAASTALLGTVAGCQGLLGGGDDAPPAGDADGGTNGSESDADGTPTGVPGDGGATDGTVSVGAGSFLDAVPEGKPTPPEDPDVAEDVSGPLPSNDWWTTLLWGRHGARLWSHPLVADAGSEGLAVGAPREWNFTNDGPAGSNFAHLP